MVSIIVPIYNVDKYLEECLASIAEQTYADYEVIMINDGSTDESEFICNKFVERDSRFRLINQKNAGVCAARTRGMCESRGEFISFIDSDDTIEKTFIEKLFQEIMKTGADFVQCDRDVNGIKEHPQWKEHIFTKSEIMPGLLKNEFFNNVCLKLYRRSLVSKISFPEDRPIMEDAVWTARVLERSNLVMRIPDTLYHYRMVPTSLTHKKLSEKEECGRFRNLIEKASTIERNISSRDSYELLNDFVLGFVPWTLGSNDDLSMFDTYANLKELIAALDFHRFENWLYNIILKNDDFRKAQKEYAFKECIQKRDNDVVYKIKVLWRYLKRHRK